MHEGIVAHADVRRSLRAARPAGAFSSGAKTASRQTYQETIAGTGGADAETLDRWRYAVRVGIRGDLVEDWFYGLRLDTGTNPRSSWVTFGNNSASSTNTAGGLAPYGKGGDGIFFGQAYLGWRATPWLTLQGGKMPNPVYTTPMVWDPDINPEGIAERINYAVNDQLTLFGNFGQYVYQSFSPNSTGGNLGFANHDGYQFAWQGGVGYKFAEATSAKVAFSWYNYTGFASPEPFYTNQNPNGFFGPFANGAQNTTPATLPNGLRFNNGVNNLSYFEIPWEVNFPVGTGGFSGARSEMSPTTPRPISELRRGLMAPWAARGWLGSWGCRWAPTWD